MPVFRVRQQEALVLKSFDFGDRIFPCLEIIKELDRVPPKSRKNAKESASLKKPKLFEDVYLTLIQSINARKVFVDLPIHLKEYRGMKKETFAFLRTVVALRAKRTEYMMKLIPLESKVIPVISTYHERTGERGSITLQEKDLRPHFKTLAFRTFLESFSNDIVQIEKVVQSNDFIIMDWADIELDINDGDQQDIIDRLKTIKCTIVIHRNPIAKGITNVGLIHDNRIIEIDNSLLEKYQDFGGDCFSDYAGIKKDDIGAGGTISPGFIYYDAVENSFYGYKGTKKDLAEFELTIVPDVISSNASQRMHNHRLDYLGLKNLGWSIITNISNNTESGKSPAKFKRIGIEHYLHCIRTRISNGDFN